MQFGAEHLPYVLIAIAVGIILGFLLFRRRQRVRLVSDSPLRPHMAQTRAKEGSEGGIAAEAARATRDVAGEMLSVSTATVPDGVADDFQRMKGVGPKFAQLLQARGFFRFAQLATLSPEEAARIDADLGPFRGRLARDRIVEQAQFLARGDQDGFEQNFGRL